MFQECGWGTQGWQKMTGVLLAAGVAIVSFGLLGVFVMHFWEFLALHGSKKLNVDGGEPSSGPGGRRPFSSKGEELDHAKRVLPYG